ncbi:hypothetical protein F4809DRAFT_628218 [Biscogniauxia mediterranea]|nr:hypothetical protein F4809DRAFT_628218 [Biscogniauxia mediterranea]
MMVCRQEKAQSINRSINQSINFIVCATSPLLAFVSIVFALSSSPSVVVIVVGGLSFPCDPLSSRLIVIIDYLGNLHRKQEEWKNSSQRSVN